MTRPKLEICTTHPNSDVDYMILITGLTKEQVPRISQLLNAGFFDSEFEYLSEDLKAPEISAHFGLLNQNEH